MSKPPIEDSAPFTVGWDVGPEADRIEGSEVVARLELCPIEPGDPSIFIIDPFSGDQVHFEWSQLLEALDAAAQGAGFADYASYLLSARLVEGPEL